MHFAPHFEGILPKGPYQPCVSMAGRALLARYLRFIQKSRLQRLCWGGGGDVTILLARTPQFVLKVWGGVAVGGFDCWLLNFGDALLLERGGEYIVTMRHSTILVMVESILELLPGSSLFYRMLLCCYTSTCMSWGDKGDLAAWQNATDAHSFINRIERQ